MSLGKQIQILVTVLSVILLTTVLKINLDSTRTLATEHLSQSTKNIADLLSYSLSSRLSDQQLLKADIDRVFDGGRFEQIVLLKRNGNIVYQRRTDITMDGIPSLFHKYIEMELPIITAQVFDQGIHFGTIQVKLDPGPFYTDLWKTFKKVCGLFIGLGIVAVVSSYLIIGILLRALQQIQYQADAISKNEFIVNTHIPQTPELKQVALAMNGMVKKVQDISKRQIKEIKHFQELQYVDAATGLKNRKFLVKRLNRYLHSDTQKNQGYFFILGIMGMEQNNIPIGHPVIQDFYINFAEILKQIIRKSADTIAARLSQQEFGVLLPNCEAEAAMTVARSAMSAIVKIIAAKSELADYLKVSCGISAYDHDDDAGSVLSKADYVLSAAKNRPSGSIDVFKKQDDQMIMGKYQWQTTLHAALTHGRFVLTAQPVMSAAKELHRELFINLTDPSGKICKAGCFMPMAISLGMASRIDKYVLERAAVYLHKNTEKTLAVNLTAAFCTDRLAMVWLRQFMDTNQTLQGKLYFEINEDCLTQHPDICIDFARMLTKTGFGLGIDQCTLEDPAIKLLEMITPAYLKIERDYFQDMEKEENGAIALNALLSITDNLNIKLIATKIEDDTLRETLLARKIKYFQGYAIAAVTPLALR